MGEKGKRDILRTVLVLGSFALTACSNSFESVKTLRILENETEPFLCKVESQKTTQLSLGQQSVQHERVSIRTQSEFQTGDIVVATVDVSCLETQSMSFKSSAFEIIQFKKMERSGAQSNRWTASLRLKSKENGATLKTIVESEPCIVAASENVPIKTSALPNDPLVNIQSHLAAIRLDVTYDSLHTPEQLSRPDVIVAVLDDGVDTDHEDLIDNVWVNEIEANGDPGVDDDNNGYIDDINGYDFVTDSADPNHKNGSFHGTHVAGLIAAVGGNDIGTIGVMPTGAKIMALNVFGDTTATSAAALDEAIRYAMNNGAHVINMSLGGDGELPTTREAIVEAVDKGIFVAAAAGNEGREITLDAPSSPAFYASNINGFVSVGASDASSSGVCGFSNFSSTFVEIAAPGCDSQEPDGLVSLAIDNQYARLNGTSMATPVLSGIAALTISRGEYRGQTVTNAEQVEVAIRQNGALRNFNGKIRNNTVVDLVPLANFILTGQTPPLASCPL